ncbi:MAG: UbiH/UbiF family hydroxylase [Nitrosomonas sp.]|nr:UbiH/UbiF family hydroxylase [Nitrosomonas sp.]
MKFDVVVIGGGLVGASLLAALQDSGLKLAIVEAKPPAPLPNDDSWDSRIYAISPGSANFLQKIGVWQQQPPERITPVYKMLVHGDDQTSRLEFSAYESGVAELAFIIENRQLQHVLWEKLATAAQQRVSIFCPAQCAAIEWHHSHAEIMLTDGTCLQTSLVVGADGVNSWVREQAGIRCERQPYFQTGVVANFETEAPHHHLAYQWFRRDGVLALLPLPGKRVSMVWSANQSRAETLLGLSGQALCEQVALASNGALGALSLITAAAGFPLNAVRVESQIQPRLVLIGDAAHGIHPLAGQGVNLGLRDARELAGLLEQFAGLGDCGEYRMLQHYARSRQQDIATMGWVTDGLQKLFDSDEATIIRLRNLGFEMTNRLPLLKNALMQHALN